MKSEIRVGFIAYLVFMAFLATIYFWLQTSSWGRHVWQILSTQPNGWHL